MKVDKNRCGGKKKVDKNQLLFLSKIRDFQTSKKIAPAGVVGVKNEHLSQKTLKNIWAHNKKLIWPKCKKVTKNANWNSKNFNLVCRKKISLKIEIFVISNYILDYTMCVCAGVIFR